MAKLAKPLDELSAAPNMPWLPKVTGVDMPLDGLCIPEDRVLEAPNPLDAPKPGVDDCPKAGAEVCQSLEP